MTTRRQFVGGALAAAASFSASANGFLPSVAGRSASSLPMGRFVVDARFPAALGFGEEARHSGVATSVVEGRVHELWYRDLFYRWRDEKMPTAGMTDARGLFLLEMMARDANMRVVHRIHHVAVGGAHAHRVFGPVELRSSLDAKMARGGQYWPEQAANIVLQWPNANALGTSTESDIHMARLHALDSQALISWIIC